MKEGGGMCRRNVCVVCVYVCVCMCGMGEVGEGGNTGERRGEGKQGYV